MFLTEQIYCFELGREYKFNVPSQVPIRPSVEFLGCKGRSKVILLGRHMGLYVWEVTIFPFESSVSGILKIGRYEVSFSTFRVVRR